MPLLFQDFIETLQKLPKAKFLDLFQRRYLRSVIVNILLLMYLCFQIPASADLLLSILHIMNHTFTFPNITPIYFFNQIAFGLMVCQQFGGINGICFYTSSIFESAGGVSSFSLSFFFFFFFPQQQEKRKRKAVA